MGAPDLANEHFSTLLVEERQGAIAAHLREGRNQQDRVVTRILTPGTLVEPELLDARSSQYLVAVLVGHAHTAAVTTFAGLPVLVGGGLVSTVPTDAEDLPVLDLGQPPTIAFHLLEDGHLVTHWRVV